MPLLALTYALAAYLFFLGTLAYAVGFVGNFAVLPQTIDSEGMNAPLWQAIAIDVGLLAVFAIQHSVMARRSFKRMWTRLVPPALERATFVLAASAALALLLWQWRPITEPVLWSVQNPAARLALQAVFWTGWAVVLVSTYLIDHFELFGLRQPWRALRGHSVSVQEFRTPLFYGHVRHPIYLGFLLAFWATPDMSAGHALFAAACTGYILIGIWFEERDLVEQFGKRYLAYRDQVGMLLPRFNTARNTGSSQSRRTRP
ncbi:methanethiol S-methyltransferase [Pelomonas cellulosilytica]|uniref:methanethiol S-methyltransferase n=1 Tax=Pelomonas cellulosilytica TaxID=2906762 RepID=A0ABS8XZF9_9BURK|nr:methanethiol S-methyltransferase [Pelomonas sp. P8]MCE4557075.1 isoprenylcysteine carboxylmethyltransferase family protein [Pelomonas sp. P8]